METTYLDLILLRGNKNDSLITRPSWSINPCLGVSSTARVRNLLVYNSRKKTVNFQKYPERFRSRPWNAQELFQIFKTETLEWGRDYSTDIVSDWVLETLELDDHIVLSLKLFPELTKTAFFEELVNF